VPEWSVRTSLLRGLAGGIRVGLIAVAVGPAFGAHAVDAASPTGIDRFTGALPFFETIGDSESIPQNVVTALAEDASGQIWIGTQLGLIRYDGYRFRRFVHDTRNNQSLAGDFVFSLWAQSDGRIWVGTRSAGISVFDPVCECFDNRFHHDVGNPGSLSDGTVTAIVGTADGAIWAGTDTGLNYLPPGSSAFEHHQANPDAQDLLNSKVTSLLLGRDGTLWVGTFSGLMRRVPTSDHFEPIAAEPAKAAALAGHEVTALFEAADGKLWVGTRTRGAAWLSPDDLSVHALEVDPSRVDRLAHPFIVAIAQPSPEEIWLGSFGGGISRVAATDGRILQRFQHHPSVIGSLAHDQLSALLSDRSGLLWVGVWGGGLQRYNPHNRSTRVLRHIPSDPTSLSQADIGSIVERMDGTLLLGTSRNGIDILDRGGALIGGFRPAKGSVGELPDGDVNAILETPDGTLWAGVQQAGVLQLAPGASTWKQYGVEHGLPTVRVHRLLLVANTLWAATDAGLARWLPEQERFEQVRGVDGKLVGAVMRAVVEDQQGRVWLGSANAGVWVLEPGASVLKSIRKDPAHTDSLISDTVNGLLVDRAGRLWVDTGQGLDRLQHWDGERASFEHISELAGRPGLYFGGNLLEDARGRIWTQWYVLDPQTLRVAELGRANGMEIGTAWIGAFVRTREGLFLFGGTEGLAIVDPERFEAWNYAPPVIATELKINGRLRPLGALVRQLELTPEQRNFSIEFAALDYSAPKKNRYAYRLHGYDRDWIETDTEHRSASYGGLWPGDYTLEVRGSGRSGEWSPQVLRVPITVLPAFWQSAWFALFIVFSLGGLAWGGLRWRTARLGAEARRLQALVDARTVDILKLGELGKKLAGSLDLETTLQTLYQQVGDRLEAAVFLVGLNRADEGRLDVLFAVEHGQRQPRLEYAMSERDRPAVWCVRERKELITSRRSELLNYLARVAEPKFGEPMESIVYLPLMSEGSVLGFVSVQSPRVAAFDTAALEFLRNLAGYAAIAIANAQSFEQVQSARKETESTLAQLQQTQQQLIQQEKMAALGTLTAGVAHEINNPTNFADGAVQNLTAEHQRLHDFLRHLAGDDADSEVLSAIAERFARLDEMTGTAREGHERIKRIVRDLRQFTRLDEAAHKSVPIAEPIQSTVNLVRTRFDRVRFELDLAFNPSIDCQPAKLGQVFMNLIMNACESISECTDGRSGVVHIRSAPDGPAVAIEIADNGHGMDEATRQRIFEPFFTTKAVGAGTGLGLAIVFGIIRDHGGSVEASSTLGQGTRFQLRLPMRGHGPAGAGLPAVF
jgi:signal transduction histidine kinase/ligand-binding sensor domain-containing protein